MFDHVKFGVSDYAASKSFFLRGSDLSALLLSRKGCQRTASN